MPFSHFQKHTAKKFRLSDPLNSQCWRFLPSDLDDFRQGFPPLCDDAIITQHAKQPEPVILPRIKAGLSRTQQRTTRMLRKNPQCSVSKLGSRMAARRGCIAETENNFTQHPFRLYPHLQESVPLELFREVVSILDPDMLQFSDEGVIETELGHCILPTIQPQLETKRNRQTTSKMTSCVSHRKGPGDKDPYAWFSKKEMAAREKEAKLNYIPPLSENVKQATKELCSWLDSLGGEKYDIDEDAIISLFDASYETQPPGSLPINAVELDDVPLELKTLAGIPTPQVTMKCAFQRARCSKKSCPTRWEKIQYGAWHLEPKTWGKLKTNEPLEDPKAKDRSIKKPRGPSGGKDAGIMQLHGTRAFKEFLEEKGYHIPEFLNRMLATEEPPARPKVALKRSLN